MFRVTEKKPQCVEHHAREVPGDCVINDCCSLEFTIQIIQATLSSKVSMFEYLTFANFVFLLGGLLYRICINCQNVKTE